MSDAELKPYLDRFGRYVAEWQRSIGAGDDQKFGPKTLALSQRAIRNSRDEDLIVKPGKLVELSPLVQATNWRWADRTEVRFIGIHDMEAAETMHTAENVAAWFAAGKGVAPMASAHYCVDADSIIPCVLEEHVAFAAKGGNRYGVHYELAGYASQTRDEWLDPYGKKMLAIAAPYVARSCVRWNIPTRKIGPLEVAAGERGICGHADITRGAGIVGGHTDPGPGFPWDYFIELVRAERVNV